MSRRRHSRRRGSRRTSRDLRANSAQFRTVSGVAAVFDTSADWSKNADRCKADFTPCALCGKGVSDAKARYEVHVVDGGGVLQAVDSLIKLPGDMGWYPVGSDCAKIVPPGFVRRIT